MLIKIVDLRTEERKARDLARVDHIALAALVTVALVTPETALAAYQKGSLMKKAQPIIDLLKDASEPLAYGAYIWAFIRYILGQRAEAKSMFTSITWGFCGIQILPWIFDIVKSLGE
jgi:hypothetical protein